MSPQPAASFSDTTECSRLTSSRHISYLQTIPHARSGTWVKRRISSHFILNSLILKATLWVLSQQLLENLVLQNRVSCQSLGRTKWLQNTASKFKRSEFCCPAFKHFWLPKYGSYLLLSFHGWLKISENGINFSKVVFIKVLEKGDFLSDLRGFWGILTVNWSIAKFEWFLFFNMIALPWVLPHDSSMSVAFRLKWFWLTTHEFGKMKFFTLNLNWMLLFHRLVFL